MVGEYELVGLTPFLAGAILGALMSELFISFGKWTGILPGVIAGAIVAGSMYWTGKINSNFGIDPYPDGAYIAAGVGALVGLVRVWRAGARRAIKGPVIKGPG